MPEYPGRGPLLPRESHEPQSDFALLPRCRPVELPTTFVCCSSLLMDNRNFPLSSISASNHARSLIASSMPIGHQLACLAHVQLSNCSSHTNLPGRSHPSMPPVPHGISPIRHRPRKHRSGRICKDSHPLARGPLDLPVIALDVVLLPVHKYHPLSLNTSVLPCLFT